MCCLREGQTNRNAKYMHSLGDQKESDGRTEGQTDGLMDLLDGSGADKELVKV